MADLSALEELLLGGYDVGALLAAQASAGQAPGGLLGLGGGLKPPLTQSGLGWAGPAPTDQSSIYQEVAQSLAAKLEEHRMQQVQVATALQTLQQLQQQEALANLTHQYLHQHGAQARAGNPFQRSRTTDLESLGRGPAAYDPMLSPGAGAAFGAGGISPADFDSHRAQMAALQHAAASGGHAGPHQSLALQRVPGVVGLQHNLPVRSFSSEHLVAGQRNRPQPGAGPGIMSQLGGPGQQGPSGSGGGGGMNGQAGAGKRAPLRQPSGLGPNGRQGQNQGGGHGGGNTGGGASGSGAGGNGNSGSGGQRGGVDGGRRARYAATAKAPSWASEDWHPMKAVIASGAHATGGTGVFLPHLATPPATPGSGGSGTGSGGATAAGSDSAAGAVKTGLASPATSVGGGVPGTSGAGPNGAGGGGLGSGRNSCDRASDHSASHRHNSGHSHSHVASANALLSGLGGGSTMMPAGPAGLGNGAMGVNGHMGHVAGGPGAALHPLHQHQHHHPHHASGLNAIGGHGPLLATPHPGMGMGGLGGAAATGLAHVAFAPPGGAPLSPLSPRDGVSPSCSAESNALGSGSGGLGSGAQTLTTTCGASAASHCASAAGASLASLGLAPSDLGMVGGLGGAGAGGSGAVANGGGSYSRGTTLESFSRASTTGWAASELDSLTGGPPALGGGGGSSVAAAAGFLTAGGADGMKVVAEEPEREREDALLDGEGECDFAALARELADLMGKQQQQGGAE
ncbi:hypothetical protein HYH02_014400 [Chlamydomonas schloesseri]|uniref:Uncharacterized protein n=1 Tax=Chlamydomonas schloesseri TaxID=2026947 RepID=A0A835VWS1_9CHLO|nr:hypothetical protein HYH02_014400 [Chlamydomonas schloesseri]|eukprot:KAG2428384.1 hypothetical protein HYH02_014400 [Chlamydomonas schloesseri]